MTHYRKFMKSDVAGVLEDVLGLAAISVLIAVGLGLPALV